MDVTKPYEFIGFGAMDVPKPYEFIGFGIGMAGDLGPGPGGSIPGPGRGAPEGSGGPPKPPQKENTIIAIQTSTTNPVASE